MQIKPEINLDTITHLDLITQAEIRARIARAEAINEFMTKCGKQIVSIVRKLCGKRDVC